MAGFGSIDEVLDPGGASHTATTSDPNQRGRLAMKGRVGKTRRQRRRQTAEHSVSQFEHERVISVERPMRPTSLAWALAEAAKPHLTPAECTDVFVAIGVGETFEAIKYLIISAARERIAFPAELVRRCHGWLDVHIGHEDEQYLRGLIEQVLAPYAIRPKRQQS